MLNKCDANCQVYIQWLISENGQKIDVYGSEVQTPEFINENQLIC